MPRLVETRALLLSGGSQVRGDLESGHYVVWEDDLAAAVGHPDPVLLRAVLDQALAVRELLVMRDAFASVQAGLSGWTHEEAVVHALPEPVPEWPLPGPGVAFLEPLTPLDHLPRDLAEDVSAARADGPVAAAWCDERPVSFCYAGSVTETLWDVSIDTLPGYRRRGFAQSAVHLMAAFHRENARLPVWGAAIGNLASLQLASRLGFVAVDMLFVFSRPRDR